ncbi:hypothetical protein FALBO_13068 [Fusarium albosuccineum]|uniref:BTB domain-containing protein n=1 Tax=Fusarium albosuccineum TaxID=1237068 RepID=A0A8H4P5Q9_9HYPO|nr:hypothetical protein FALBO_13068 [Fusarium albosuccineum]
MKAETMEKDAPPQAATDQGPEPIESPYLGSSFKLEFADQRVVRVQRRIIAKHPKFEAHFKNRRLELSDMTEGQAHILLHYLYTGKYDTMEPQGESAPEKNAKAFAISLWVYAAAVEYDLDHLAVLATIQLSMLGSKLTFLEIVRIMDREEFCLGEDETWLVGYLAERAGDPFVEPVTQAQAQSLRAGIGERRTLVNLLLETIVDLKLELQKTRGESS